MEFAENLSNIDVNNPFQVSTVAELDVLQHVHENEFLTIADLNAHDPIVVQFTQEIHRHFRGVIGADEVHKAFKSA